MPTSDTGAKVASQLALISAACGDQLPLPPRGDEQVFAEPWQAQVFAMTVALHERGVFDWPEWAKALGTRVAHSDDPSGADYYLRWSEALIDVLDRAELIDALDLACTETRWHEAAARTPHGHPILLGQEMLE